MRAEKPQQQSPTNGVGQTLTSAGSSRSVSGLSRKRDMGGEWVLLASEDASSLS